jgi:hypothetical protein
MCMFYFVFIQLIGAHLLLKHELLLVLEAKHEEHIPTVHLYLKFDRDMASQLLELFVFELQICVTGPLVLEKAHNLHRKFVILDIRPMVQSLNESQEPCELRDVFVVSVLPLELIKHIDEDSHDVGKYHHAKQHEKCDEHTLRIALGVIVTEPNSG